MNDWLNDLQAKEKRFRHYKSPPFHTVIRIHLIPLSSHISVFVISFCFHGAHDNLNVCVCPLRHHSSVTCYLRYIPIAVHYVDNVMRWNVWFISTLVYIVTSHLCLFDLRASRWCACVCVCVCPLHHQSHVTIYTSYTTVYYVNSQQSVRFTVNVLQYITE